jgi:hypothetical protein
MIGSRLDFWDIGHCYFADPFRIEIERLLTQC